MRTIKNLGSLEASSEKNKVVYENSACIRTLPVSDIRIEMARGLFSGTQVVHKFGNNPSVGSSSYEDVWILGGTFGGWFQSTQSLEILSSNTNDTLLGTGARVVKIYGLNSNWDGINEEVSLNGTSAVSLSNSYIRITRLYVKQTGTYGGSNLGNITLRVSGGGASCGYIDIGDGQSEQTMYSIPRGKTAYLTKITCEASSSNGSNIIFLKRENANSVIAPFQGAKRVITKFDDLVGVAHLDFYSYVSFPEYTDLWFIAKSTGGGNAQVDVNYDLILIDN